ncbi:hypothetical protein [Coleofasciculus sp. H7-2]|uniref:hypothetical protein n=1 Tax=Coleofasciculus sp. H7-2 TaxID=3351545 RepID=UPI00366A915D
MKNFLHSPYGLFVELFASAMISRDRPRRMRLATFSQYLCVLVSKFTLISFIQRDRSRN